MTLRKLALASAIIYAIAGTTLVTAKTNLHTWQIEYDGNYYTYVADTYDNPNAYIIDLDGNKIYVTTILGGDNA